MEHLKRHLTAAAAHRAAARAALMGNWAVALIIALLIDLIVDARPVLIITFTRNVSIQILPPDEMVDLFHRILGIPTSFLMFFSVVFFVIGLLITGVLELGSARYNLNLIDRKKAHIRDLFSCFPRFADALVMHLLQQLLTFLGMLLFLVPGIMLLCGCAMAPYILSEDPDCNGREALMRSWAMMQGHKLELLWLELSFIGWGILSKITWGVGTLFLNPYKAAARASFYRDLSRGPEF